MSTSNQMTEQDYRTDRTNKIVTSVVGCVLLGIAGIVAFSNVDTLKGLKVPDRNDLWAKALKKKVLKPWEPPKFEPTIDWSDPKNDPNKIAERLNLNKPPLQIEQQFGHQFQQSNHGPWRPGQR
jgi:hypothetical protein